MTSFLRFLSKRAKSCDQNRHQKLNGCEDLKEALESLNNRHNQATTMAKGTTAKNNLINNNLQTNKTDKPNHFLSFKSLQKYTQKQKANKNQIECAVIFLDGTQESFFVDKKTNGDKLYEKVFYHLDLIETDYFGLQYTDTHNVQHWLDANKPIRKQCKIGPPFTFFFKVKFYTTEPNNLKEEITRYFYFLQLKSDIRTGRLACTVQISIELAALTLQEELGDYDANVHNIDTVSEFRFVPDVQQNEEFEENVLKYYHGKCAGLTPAEAELMYLNKAKWLELYGVDMHQVYGRDQNEYKLGLTPSGILVFEGEQKIGLFYWPKIEKITFTKKKFTIIVTEDDDNGYKQEHTFIFNLIDEKACKHLWKCAVEYHAFFRLRTSPKPLNHGLNGFIRHASRFRGPQRTEFQTANLTLSTRRSVQFERRPSQRFTRRASYALKRKMQEQQQRQREQNTESKSSKSIEDHPRHPVNMTTTHAAEQNPKQSATSAAVGMASTSACLSNDCCSSAAISSIKEDAENAQARLKQIEIESTCPVKVAKAAQQQQQSIGTTRQQQPAVVVAHGNCCKLQQANGGNDHDVKCNLLKAQQYNSNAACKKQQHCETCERASDPQRNKQQQQPDTFDTVLQKQKDIGDMIVDKNEQHNNNNDNDRVKLVDKEPITSTITAAACHVQTNTETTITTAPTSAADAPSSSATCSKAPNRKSEVIITRTQSIYNDRNASSAILHINTGSNTAISHPDNDLASTGPFGHHMTSMATNSLFISKPITTEL